MQVRPLLVVGNKRSGTSLLTRLLNAHPQVFITHESDAVWLLYQQRQRQAFRAHPSDSDVGMRTTLQCCHLLPDAGVDPWIAFQHITEVMMTKGTPWMAPTRKRDLRWIGDKKPFQHTDPPLLEFIEQHFPEPHFVHLVRHPFAVVDSSDRFNRTPQGDFWVGLSAETKLARWTEHEQAVLDLKARLPHRVYSLRYEDLCTSPLSSLRPLFAFLGLEAPTTRFESIHPPLQASQTISTPPRTAAIAALYGYRLSSC
jgi:hypothetical protein